MSTELNMALNMGMGKIKNGPFFRSVHFKYVPKYKQTIEYKVQPSCRIGF